MKKKYSRWHAFKPYTFAEKRAGETEVAIKKYGLGTKQLAIALASIIEKYKK